MAANADCYLQLLAATKACDSRQWQLLPLSPRWILRAAHPIRAGLPGLRAVPIVKTDCLDAHRQPDKVGLERPHVKVQSARGNILSACNARYCEKGTPINVLLHVWAMCAAHLAKLWRDMVCYQASVT